MLRFEHFKFVHMSMKQWNRSLVTPMRLVHTLTPEPDSRMKKKQRLQTATASMSLCDGTRLIMIKRKVLIRCQLLGRSTTCTRFGFRIVVNCTENCKLADEQGKWVHCGAHGRHAENNSLEHFLRIVVYFGSGRLATRHTPRAISLFNDAFIVPLERRFNPPPLSKQVKWQ